MSADSAQSHLRFSKRHQFPFPLLVDTNGALAKAWGLPKAMLGLSPPRVTCVVDIEGILRAKIQSVVPHLHAEKALKCVRALNGLVD